MVTRAAGRTAARVFGDDMDKFEEDALKRRACCFCWFWRRGAFCKLFEVDTVNQNYCTPENGKKFFVSKEYIMRRAWELAIDEAMRNQMVACHALQDGKCILKQLVPELTCPHRRKNDNCGLVGEPFINLRRIRETQQTLEDFKKMMEKVRKFPVKKKKKGL